VFARIRQGQSQPADGHQLRGGAPETAAEHPAPVRQVPRVLLGEGAGRVLRGPAAERHAGETAGEGGGRVRGRGADGRVAAAHAEKPLPVGQGRVRAQLGPRQLQTGPVRAENQRHRERQRAGRHEAGPRLPLHDQHHVDVRENVSLRISRGVFFFSAKRFLKYRTRGS